MFSFLTLLLKIFYYKHSYLISEIIFLLGKHLVLQIFRTKSHMWFVQHNVCQEKVLSNITCAWYRFCPT